jgi:hypothetical protein
VYVRGPLVVRAQVYLARGQTRLWSNTRDYSSEIYTGSSFGVVSRRFGFLVLRSWVLYCKRNRCASIAKADSTGERSGGCASLKFTLVDFASKG